MVGEAALEMCHVSYRLDDVYRPHVFDFPDEKERAKKGRRVHVSTGDQPLRGMKPVREYFRINEANIKATVRMGLRDNTQEQ